VYEKVKEKRKEKSDRNRAGKKEDKEEN